MNESRENMVRVIYAPTYELAKTVKADASVEAEYGSDVAEGASVTLAHHGPRSGNPAPCNTDVGPEDLGAEYGGTVLVSHLDLDTIGGIMALEGTKPDDREFWQGAEFIDVNGPHHIHELPEHVQDKLNAFYALENELRKAEELPPRDSVSDVTKAYTARRDGVAEILTVDRSPLIEAGREWAEKTTADVESKLAAQNNNVRMFVSDSVFCNGAYHIPGTDRIAEAIVTLNTKRDAITLSFEDGGKKVSAVKVMQDLFGPGAGGRDGIAGSPRGVKMTTDDLGRLYGKVSELLGCERENDRAEGRPVPGSTKKTARASSMDDLKAIIAEEKTAKGTAKEDHPGNRGKNNREDPGRD